MDTGKFDGITSGDNPAFIKDDQDDTDSSTKKDTHVICDHPNGDLSTEHDHDKIPDKNSCKSIAWTVVKVAALPVLLYFFICSLHLLSNAFTLLGGKAMGKLFQNSALLNNPICGLIIGVIFTAFLQSSSTTTSIVITMVASDMLGVSTAIPIVMGANIGTSITGILVASTQIGDRAVFERAFSAATVHDMFNWLTVIVLLPLETVTHYLYKLTNAILDSTSLTGGGSETEFLSVLTDPLTNFIVMIDRSVLDAVARNVSGSESMSLLKNCSSHVNGSDEADCWYIFSDSSLKESVVGIIVLAIAMVTLLVCLGVMVKVLNSLLAGSVASVIHKAINSELPGKAAFLTGYIVIIVGAVVTMLVQSSSVVASALTPLVGLNVVTVDRVYPMMLGANVGTTSTAMLAAFAASGDTIRASLQIALCHLFFNLSGIIIWYVVPPMRSVPINLAKFLGKTTAKYRWFAILYIGLMFFAFPALVFGLSILGWQYALGAVIFLLVIIIPVAIIKCLQNKRPQCLPHILQNWKFLPEFMRSLSPLDRQITKVKSCNCKCWCNDKSQQYDVEDNENGNNNYKKMPKSETKL